MWICMLECIDWYYMVYIAEHIRVWYRTMRQPKSGRSRTRKLSQRVRSDEGGWEIMEMNSTLRCVGVDVEEC